jgi:hypothetical protein
MDQFVELLKEVNIAQVFIILSGLWVFYNRLDKKIDKLDEKMDKMDGKLNGRIDSLNQKVEDVDRRLCRIEGSLQSHGHCMFSQSNPQQKAQ